MSEKTLKKNLIYKGKILDLYCDDVVCHNGNITKREIIHHNGGVCILGFKDNKVILVRQYRYALGKDFLELPAGKIEKGEDPDKAAYREFEEETGLKPIKLTKLGKIVPTCGYSDEIISLYVVNESEESHRDLDVDEDIDLVYLPLEEVEEKIDNGEIIDAKTIALIYHFRRHLIK